MGQSRISGVKILGLRPNTDTEADSKKWRQLNFLPTCKFNPKPGGGSYVPTAQEIACNFSQDHARILRLLDFFKNDFGPRAIESF